MTLLRAHDPFSGHQPATVVPTWPTVVMEPGISSTRATADVVVVEEQPSAPVKRRPRARRTPATRRKAQS